MTDPEPSLADPEALEAMARQLEASGRYRLLRRFEGCTLSTPSDPSTLRQGVYLDVETTGKDAARDEIIELAMVPFQYDAEGRLCAGEGFEGTKLSYLASQCGFFFDGHRAENDCLAGLEILARPLPSGRTALAHMLDAARAPTWRIAAERAPYDFKDKLKDRGYRWNGDEALAPKAWYIDVPEADREAELDYLRQEIYGGEVHLAPRRITAFERFSDRA